MSPGAVSDLRDRGSVGRRARRNDTSNRGKRGREEPGEVDEERENVTGNVRAVARLELRLSRNEGWWRMRIGMVHWEGREVSGAPVENARRRDDRSLLMDRTVRRQWRRYPSTYFVLVTTMSPLVAGCSSRRTKNRPNHRHRRQ